MKVLKFGGTSVGSPERIKTVMEICRQRFAEGPLTVVVSAFGGITNQLLACSKAASIGDEGYKQLYKAIEDRTLENVRALIPPVAQTAVMAEIKRMLNKLAEVLQGVFLVREVSPKTQDYILSFGELTSAKLIAWALEHSGQKAAFVDARELLLTNSRFGNAQVDLEESYIRIAALGKSPLAKGIMVVPGFIAANPEQHTTTLGRGGSDFSAALMAAGLHAALLEIWTDVSGVMTADPRKVKTAFPVPSMTYEEAMELSHFGAKVIYPPSVQPVRDRNIPVLIKNTFEPDAPGTLIGGAGSITGQPVTGLSSIDQISLVSLSGSGLIGVPGVSSRLFGALARNRINVILITQASSEHSITFGISPDDTILALQAVEEEFSNEIILNKVDPLEVEDDLAIIALVGEQMKHKVGLSGKMFSTLGHNGVNIRAIAQGSSERNVSTVIPRKDVKKALNVLHEAFFFPRPES